MGHIHHNQMKEKQFGGVKFFFGSLFCFYTNVCVMLVIFFDVLPF